MLHSTQARLILPPYEDMKEYEGKGNWAIGKYYKPPFSFFYKKKLKLILSLFPKDKIYHNILDFGSGPGIFLPSLKKKALFVKGYEPGDIIDSRWRFEAIVCSSVLEFVNLESTFSLLYSLLKPGGHIYIGSPMKSRLTNAYFKLIGDKNYRSSHTTITSELKHYFKVEEYREWMNLYFVLRASRLSSRA